MDQIAFVCRGNAGRSQLVTAFAERERNSRNLPLEIVMGGTKPADHVHDDVVEVLREKGIDISERSPRRISSADMEGVDLVITMGCSIDDVRPEGWEGTVERWEVDHPDGDDLELARSQRNEIERRVIELFDRMDEI